MLLALTTMATLLPLNGCVIKDFITRGEWISMLSETFGMDSYTKDTPAYSDVTSESSIFAYVQSAAEWGVLPVFSGDRLEISKTVTRKEAASTAALAAGYKPGDSFDADSAISYAVENKILDNSKKLTAHMTKEECEAMLSAARKAYLNIPFTEKAVAVKTEDVVDISDSIPADKITATSGGLSFPGKTYTNAAGQTAATVNTASGEKEVTAGSILITPGSQINPAGVAHKIVSISGGDGTVFVGTEAPTLEELYDELDVDMTVEANPDNIIWATGFTGGPASSTGMSYNDGGSYRLDLLAVNNGPCQIVPLDSRSYTTKAHADFEFGNGKFEKSYPPKKNSSNLGVGKGAQALNESNFSYNKTPSIEDFKGKTDSWTENLKVENKFSGGYKISGYIDINAITVRTTVDYKRTKWLKIPYGVENASIEVSSDITSYLKLEGNLKEELKVGSVPIPIAATGLSVSVDLYIYVTADGTLEVKATAGSSAKVEYAGGKLRQAGESHMEASVDAALEINFGANVSATLDALGIIKIVDAGVKVGGNLSASAHIGGSCKVSEDNGVSKITYQESLSIKADLYVPIVKIYAGGSKKTLIGSLGIGGEYTVLDKSNGAACINIIDEEWVFWEETVLADKDGNVTDSETTTAGEKDGVGASDEDVLDFMVYVITLKNESKAIELDLHGGTAVPEIIWSSDNTSVATVDGSGVVTPLKEGYTIITATLKSNPAVYVKCAVFVGNGVKGSMGGSGSGGNDDWEFLPADMPTAA